MASEPGMASFAAQPGEQLAAAAQEPEPASPPLAEPAMASASTAHGNGALSGASETGGLLEALASTAPGAAGRADAFAPHAALERAAPAASPDRPPELAAPEPAAAPRASSLTAAPDGDEEHWRHTYDEFLKVREQCGESRLGLPYERFRQKLQKNRDQLVAKYGCRTVRFHAYVKEGRAALKASPVR